MPFLRAGLVALVATLVAAPAASALTAPGAVTYAFDVHATVGAVDVSAPPVGVAAPDGSVVLAGDDGHAGLLLVRLRADGAPDHAFGTDGVLRVPVPHGGPTGAPTQILRRPDGHLLVVFDGAVRGTSRLPRLLVASVAADGRLDASFGSGGVADAGIASSFGGQAEVAALQPDGSLVVSGTTGALPLGSPAPPRLNWVLARLTPAGTVDRTYGQQGVATVQAAAGNGGVEVAALPDGSVLALGGLGDGGALARVTAAGTLDPTFHGGTPLPIPAAWTMAAHADGSVDVVTREQSHLLRFTATGAVDPAVGATGAPVADGTAAQQLLARPDGSELIITTNFSGALPASAVATPVHADGTLGTATPLAVPFGGGQASLLGSSAVRPLDQSGYVPAAALLRADGALVLAGGVAAVRYRGEGEGSEHQEGAVAAYGPDLRPDPSFGGPRAAARITASVPRQRAASALGSRTRSAGVTVRVVASGAGLALVRVRAGGLTIAETTALVVGPGAHRLVIPLTPTGRARLSRAHGLRVTASVAFADLVRSRATAHASGRLR